MQLQGDDILNAHKTLEAVETAEFEITFTARAEGYNDKTDLKMTLKMKKGNEELEAWLSRMLSPRINFRFFEVPMDEGIVVILEIPCAEKQPVQFSGVEYIRIGTNKKNLKEYPDKERELWRTFDCTPYELRIAMGSLDEDEMISLLDYSRYYDKLEMPIPRNRDKVLEDLHQLHHLQQLNYQYKHNFLENYLL